jgi:hypothetical protein
MSDRLVSPLRDFFSVEFCNVALCRQPAHGHENLQVVPE